MLNMNFSKIDSLIDVKIDHSLAKRLPLPFAKRHFVLPMREEEEDVSNKSGQKEEMSREHLSASQKKHC